MILAVVKKPTVFLYGGSHLVEHRTFVLEVTGSQPRSDQHSGSLYH